MKKHSTVPNAALAAALATLAATAWATGEALFTAPTHATILPIDHKVLNPEAPVAADETLGENETFVKPHESMPPQAIGRAAPAAERPALAEPPITIEHRRLTLDERIQADVLERIASAQNVSGKVGVETHDAIVTITGRVTNAVQAYRVERMARGVDGVRDVDNRIRARVGGST